MVPFACMPSPIPRQDRWKLVRSYDSINFGLPRNRGGSAPALTFSRPAQRSLTLRPACSPSRLNDLLHQRLQRSRCLHRCSDCYRVERTSSRAGLTPAVDHHLFTAHAVSSFTRRHGDSSPRVARPARIFPVTRERWAQIGITAQFLIVVRTLGEYFRLRHVQGTSFSATVAAPYIGGALLATCLCWAGVTLY